MVDRGPRPGGPDPADRAGAALHALLEPLPDLDPFPPRPGPAPLRRDWRLTAHQLGLWAVAASALLLVVLLQLLPVLAPAPAARPEDPVVLPDPFPAYSHLASAAERDPAGPALMAFTYGLGVELMDEPTAVVLGADGGTYRHLSTAGVGASRPFRLSPDGTAVAVGTRGTDGRLTVVDLRTGDRQSWRVRRGSSLFPAAWSPDGRSVFVTTSGGSFPDSAGARPRGDWGLHRVNLTAPRDRAVATLPSDPDHAATVAPVPGEDRLLVATGRSTQLRSGDGVTTLVGDVGVTGHLLHASVSPDGRHVAVAEGSEEVTVLPLRDGRAGGAPTAPLGGPKPKTPGWLVPPRVLVGTKHKHTTALRLHLRELDVVSGRRTELLVAEPGWTGASVTQVSMATDLLPELTVRPVAELDRGYPHVVVRALAGLLTLVLAHRVWRTWRSRTRWRAAG